MQLQALPPDLANFQIGYLPKGLLLELEKKERIGDTAALKQTPVQYIAVSIRSRNNQRRRLIFRQSLFGAPDVSCVVPCDLRVQQLLWESPEGNTFHTSLTLPQHTKLKDVGRISATTSISGFVPIMSKSQETLIAGSPEGQTRQKFLTGSESSNNESSGDDDAYGTGSTSKKHPTDYYGYEMSHEDGTDNDVVGGKREEAATVGVTTLGRKHNDYRREIDLAHHIFEMEHGEIQHGFDGGGSCGKMAKEEHATTTSSTAAQLFHGIPSTVRFNDALVCTSKDVQILKSGAIKMMRLTVICHSDLHYYQNHHSRKHHYHHQSQKYFGNETTPKEATEVILFPSKPTTTATYSSSSTSSVQVTMVEEERKETGENSEKKRSTPTRQTISQENETKGAEAKRHEKEKGEHILSQVYSSSYHHPTHHHSNQEETNSNEKNEKCKRNWIHLQEKLGLIFQTYDIHVGPNTLINLKGCPLASFPTKFTPAVGFIFVEECEMITKSKKANVASVPDVGKVSGKTEIIITNVHHISYYERIVEMSRSSLSANPDDPSYNIYLYGLEHTAKILNGMIKTSGWRIGQVENPVVPVTYTTTTAATTPGLLAEFSHGLLISGPSGCGKVVVVRETAKKLGAHLLSFNPSFSAEDSPSRFCQQLTDIFTSALATASRYQTVLLFPRIHLLFQQQPNSNLPSTGSTSRNNNQARALHHLCRLFDSIPAEWPLTVVGTTDKAFLLPIQLRRAGRLEKEIIISPPKESDRLAILQHLSWNMTAFRSVDFSDVASQTPGYVAQDLLKVLRLAVFKYQEEADALGSAGEKSGQITAEQMRYAVRRVVPSVLEGALGVVDIQRAISLDHIAGLHSVKLDLIKAIVWPLKHPEAFLRMGISPSKGILLYGPPGNCKTTLVRAVAATHQTNFLSVSAAELFSSGVGDSEKIVAHLFHRARMASPCILFIDELEAIVGSRQNSEKKQTGTNESILSMLLTEMDGVGATRITHPANSNDCSSIKTNHKKSASSSSLQTKSLGQLVLVVAATNRPDLIDPALLRPGRFDKLIGVPPLDRAGRRELLKWCAKSVPFERDVDFDLVAASTEGFSGADLVNLCREAALFSLSDSRSATLVGERHVKMAKSVVVPSLTPELVQRFYEYGSGHQTHQR